MGKEEGNKPPSNLFVKKVVKAILVFLFVYIILSVLLWIGGIVLIISPFVLLLILGVYIYDKYTDKN